MLLLTLGASLALLLIAGTTQGCELTAHLYTTLWVEIHLSNKAIVKWALGSAVSYIQHW